MEHHFDIDIAADYGICPAIILNNIHYWIEKNRANGQNFYDGNYWTYCSVKGFNALFPYMSPKTIRTALEKLIESGLITTGNYNKSAYDRTMWYSITEKGYSTLQKGQMHLPKTANGSAQNGKPIPDINTDSKPDIKETVSDETVKKAGNGGQYSSEFERFWEAYPRCKRKKYKQDAWKAFQKVIQHTTIEDILSALEWQSKSRDWTKQNGEYIPMPTTWLNKGGWADEPPETAKGKNYDDKKGWSVL